MDDCDSCRGCGVFSRLLMDEANGDPRVVHTLDSFYSCRNCGTGNYLLITEMNVNGDDLEEKAREAERVLRQAHDKNHPYCQRPIIRVWHIFPGSKVEVLPDGEICVDPFAEVDDDEDVRWCREFTREVKPIPY